MYRLAVYGKGGVGKSTVSANLSYLLSLEGSVLHVGCDPKHDSTRLLTGGVAIRTFFSDTDSDPVVIGCDGVMCVECGGAEPGAGCAGKGLELLFSRISGVDADYRVSDVLGDVVCGGFSVPARRENCDAIIIVTSGEFMSLFAANNILRGLMNINPGHSVLGIVFNRRGDEGEEDQVRRFADAVDLPILCDLPRSDLFRRAEAEGEVLCSLFPDSQEAEALRGLVDVIRKHPMGRVPTPLNDEQLSDLATGREIRGGLYSRRVGSCTFETFDSERNVTYRGDFIVPSCTSHGAVEAALRVSDAAVILHGPRNCAYLMDYAFRRRAVMTAGERVGPIPPCNLYSTGMDATKAFTDSVTVVEDAVLRARADGFGVIFLVPTCTTEVMGADLTITAKILSERHGVDVIPVRADDNFLGSKFGGTFGIFDVLIGLMEPRNSEPGTVNLVGRWFHGTGKDLSRNAIDRLIGLLGLRVNCRFLDFCSLDDIRGFSRGKYDIQIGRTRMNDRICESLASRTGRRRALRLDVPTGLGRCLQWIRDLGEFTGRSDMVDEASEAVRREFEDGMSIVRPRTEGKRVVVFCRMVREIDWQVETLQAMGMDVIAVIFADDNVVDHNVVLPEFGDIRVIDHGTPCTIAEVCGPEGVDIVVTNDPERIRRHGHRWAPLASRHYGISGAVDWAGTVADCLTIRDNKWEAGL